MVRVVTHLGLALMLLLSTPIAALCSVRCLTTPAEAPPSVHCHQAGEATGDTPTRSSHDSAGCLCAIEAPRIGSRLSALTEMPVVLTALMPHALMVPGPDATRVALSALVPPGRGTPFDQRNPPLLL